MTELERPKRVLFVCYENASRSQMAEAFANMYGAGQVEAYRAGCHPAEAVHPTAVVAMQELGYDLRRRAGGVNPHFSPAWARRDRLLVAEFARIRVLGPNSGEFGYRW